MPLEYLDHYCSLRRPGYAVLVTGPWGSGKTHQVRHALAERPHLYVSLYGEPTVEAIHEAVLAAASPVRTESRDRVRRVGQAGGEIGGALGFGASLLTPLVLRQMRRTLDENHLIVFDDLERSPLEPKTLAGLVNGYLEHRGCRVIVLAEEERLRPEADWRDAREKLFGQTLRVEPNVAEAMSAFFTENRRRSVARESTVWDSERIRAGLTSVFVDSAIPSLRVARQVTHDVERLLGELSDAQLANEQALLETLRHFAAWSGEVRAGRLGREHLGPYAEAAIELGVAQEDLDALELDPDTTVPRLEPLIEAIERYRPSGIDFWHGPLRRDVLSTALFDGRYAGPAIRESLDTHPAYASATSLPAWRVLRERHRFTVAELEATRARLEAELQRAGERHPGVMTHRFARLLWLAAEGIGDRDLDQASELCERCIETWVESVVHDARSGGATPDLDLAIGFEAETSHDGLAFLAPSHSAYPRFRELRAHFAARAAAALDAVAPALAEDALERMSVDPSAFGVALAADAARAGRHARHGFLRHVDVERFVERCLTAAPHEQHELMHRLRRHVVRVDETIGEDDRWIDAVARELDRRANEASGFERLRLRDLASLLQPTD